MVSEEFSELLAQKLQEARQKGIACIVAAGNSGQLVAHHALQHFYNITGFRTVAYITCGSRRREREYFSISLFYAEGDDPGIGR